MPTEIFTDHEKDKLSALASDAVLMGALKKHFLAGIYQQGTITADPLKNFALGLHWEKDNAQIGAELRACIEGIQLLETAFKQLSSYKKEAPSGGKPKGNRAK